MNGLQLFDNGKWISSLVVLLWAQALFWPLSPFSGEFSASDSSLTDIQETRRQPMPDPGLMPLPDAAADLDWSNLVDAAKAYEGECTLIHTGQPGVLRAMLLCAELWPSLHLSCCLGYTGSTCASTAQPQPRELMAIERPVGPCFINQMEPAVSSTRNS